tara:strand:- start:32531 stop:33433 length:903 start_codon:yes stop_codon:yes gene_type:complete
LSNYFYKTFNKTLNSDKKIVFFEERIPSVSSDIKIIQKKLSNHYVKNSDNSFKNTTNDKCVIFLKSEIIYEINKSGEIYYECFKKFDESSFAKLICNMALPMYFVLNDFLAVHASAATVNGKNIIFSGKSGNGKSNALLDCLQKGGELITEDLAIISNTKNSSYILPAYPVLNIKKEMTHRLINKDLFYEQVSLSQSNNKLPIKIKKIAKKSRNIELIIFLEWADENSFKQISEKDAFLRIIANSWHSYPFVKDKNRTEIQIQNITQLVSNSETYLLRRNKNNINFAGYSLLDEIIHVLR